MKEDVAIKVNHVSKIFKLPHEKQTSVKNLILNFYKMDKGYERQQALSDVSFTVKQGDFFGIVGRNGSGKSTLLKILAGIYNPTKGSTEVIGKLTPFIELGVGFSPDLTGRENVFLNGALLGFSRKEMAAMYKDIVEFAELERFMDQKLKNYSSGMHVRLAFSIAIRAKGDILLLDEVLAVGDVAFQKKCFDYFKELKKNKQTVVFVSHDMDAVEKYCNTAVLINNGKIIDEGEPKEIAAQYRLLNTSERTEVEEVSKPTKLSDEVEINKVTINGAKQVVVNSDQELVLKVLYTSKRLNSYIVSMSIIRNDTDQHIAYCDTRKTTKKLEAKSGQQFEVTCRFPTDQFVEGVYDIDIDIRDKNDIYLRSENNSVSFSVTHTDPSKAGLINLKAEWEVTKD